jgi:hypothetical protein
MGKKTVAIVGSNPLSRGHAPWDSDIPIWVFNEASAGWAKDLKVAAVFQLHLPMIFRSRHNHAFAEYYEWLKDEKPYPIYMQEKYPDVPSSVRLPLDEMVEILPAPIQVRIGKEPERTKYFTSSVAYAIAFAIYEGYERIEIYGVETLSDTEYVQQRDGITLWMGIALGMGIEIEMHTAAGFLSCVQYGYEGSFMVDRQLLEAAYNAWSETKEKCEEDLRRSEARLGMWIDRMGKADTPESQQKATTEYYGALKKHINTVLEYGIASGIVQENVRYLDILDERIKAAGCEKAEEVYEYEKSLSEDPDAVPERMNIECE